MMTLENLLKSSFLKITSIDTILHAPQPQKVSIMLLVLYVFYLFYVLIMDADIYVFLLYLIFMDNIVNIDIQIINVLIFYNNCIQTYYDFLNNYL